MKTLRKITLAGAALAVAFSGAALACPAGGEAHAQGMGMHGGAHGQGMGHGMGRGMAMHAGQGGHAGGMHGGQGMEQRLTTLKSELKLTSQQEPAWQKFEQAVKAQQTGHGQGHGAMQPGADPMQSRIAWMEQRLAGMKTVAKAQQDLYKVLTPEQKSVADSFFGAPVGQQS